MSTFPLPNKKGIGEQFWNALNERKFLIPYCNNCKTSFFYPRVVCPSCGDTNVEFQEHYGKGEIYSFTVVERTTVESFAKDVPYVVGIVKLDGGAKMMSRIVDCNPNEVNIGTKVKVKYKKITDDVTLPYFRPVEGGN